MNNIECIKLSLGSWERTAKLLFDILATQPNQESIKSSINERLPKKQEKKSSGRRSRMGFNVKHDAATIGIAYRDGSQVSNHEAAEYVIKKDEEFGIYTPENEKTRKDDIRNLEKRISDLDTNRKKGSPRH